MAWDMTVGIVCPAPLEYQVCRDVLEMSDEAELSGRLVSTRCHEIMKIVAVQSGPGKIQSASATQLVIDRFTPDIIIDAGGAGSLSVRVSIFDIVLAENAYEYDVCTMEEFPQLADDLTTLTILRDLSKKQRDILQRFMEKVKREKSIELMMGNIVSGERNVKDRSLREALNTAFGAVACNWETSAVLKTGHLNGVKTMAFRVITDNAGMNMKKELKANWKNALMILYPVLGSFLFEGWLRRILTGNPSESEKR
jgi:adenosylhomocysteine nucleosidase